MALRILQFSALFGIGFYLGPTTPFARAGDIPEIPEIALSLQLIDPKDVIVPKGKSATLRCDSRSTLPGLQVIWLHNNSSVPLDDNRWIQQEDGSLYIPKVLSGKRANGVIGEYQCLVRNEAGALLSGTAKLRVASMDREFTKNPRNVTVAVSQPVLLRCSIHSTPPADIHWEFNNQPLPQHTRYVPLPSGALLISNSQISDTGSYRCKATNRFTKDRYSKIAVLTVSGTPPEAKPPTFLPLDISLNNTVLVGEGLTLFCAVIGWPTPVLQWYNDDGVVIGNSTVLRILKVKVHDSGNYTCVAYNSLDRISQNYRVEVQSKPYFNMTPISRAYPAARTVRLDCQAAGVPEPRIYYLKNGKPLVYDGRMSKKAAGLVISNTFRSDSGIYQCVAVNSAGRVWTAVQIEIDSPLSSSFPENVQCRSYDETSVCLSWDPLLDVSVQAYSIHLVETSGKISEIIINNTDYLYGGLLSSTNYSFFIRGYTNAASDPSETVSCKTGVEGNRNLDIVPINLNSVNLSWSQISTDVPCDGVSNFYKVQWKREGYSTINVECTMKHNHVITGLVPGINYEFRITSLSYDTGFAAWVPYTHSKTEDSFYINEETESSNVTNTTPPPPEQLEGNPLSPTSIKLTWLDVSNKKLYTVCYITVKEGKRCEEGILLESYANKLTVTELKSNTMYEFKVRTHNLKGISGSFSKSIEVETPADVPSPVLDLKYKVINDSTACLHWKSPVHKNGKLLNYIISYTPDRDRPLEEWTDITIPSYQRILTACWLGDEDTVSGFLGNLSLNTQYTVLVRAVSDVGIGKPAVPIVVTTNLGVSTNEQVPDQQGKIEYHKKVGVIVGVIMALICIVCCITCILVRRRCVKRRALATARLAAANNYYPAVARYASNIGAVQVKLEEPCAANAHEIEHLVSEGHSTHIPPISPSHLDTKGGEEFPNGHVNGSAKPYMNGHLSNGHVHITENPQFYAFESNGHVSLKKPKHSSMPLRYEEDSNSNVKSSKFYDLYRLFENSKKSTPNYHQCNPHFEQNISDLQNSDTDVQSLAGDSSLDATQLTCVDDSLGSSVVNNHRRISPVLGPNG